MGTRLIQLINTYEFASPSPDPSGIVYLYGSNTLLISDSEVNENPVFNGSNLFEISLTGSVTNYGDVLNFSGEPTGLSYDPGNGSLFISDDAPGSRRIYELNAGSDNTFGTSDDFLVGSFSTVSFGSNDAEDVAFEITSGHLFISDGLDRRIYEVTRDGTLVNSFSTIMFGLADPEGIAYNPESGHFFIVGEPVDEVFEVTREGNLVQRLEIGEVNPIQPAGIEVAPRSTNSNNLSLYIVDRGIDESVDPNENDGRLYEFALEASIYATSINDIVVNGVNFQDEDVMAYNSRTGNWYRYLDGSDIGLGDNDIDALHVNDDGSVLLSLENNTNISDFGFVNDSDIIRFVPTSIGNNTTGIFERYFDGSDVGLDGGTEDIDAIAIAPNGDILISTLGPHDINGLRGTDEDVVAFSPTSLGSNTAGTFSRYFDGSDVGLNNLGSEDTKGIALMDDGELVLSSQGDFQVAGLSGSGGDLYSFTPDSLGNNTSGSFALFSSSLGNGFDTNVIGDFSLV